MANDKKKVLNEKIISQEDKVKEPHSAMGQIEECIKEQALVDGKAPSDATYPEEVTEVF
ncbi:hypothetical protein G3V94_24260 [Escherichia coli]|nr:hypothetical protein [Escherichia coli]